MWLLKQNTELVNTTIRSELLILRMLYSLVNLSYCKKVNNLHINNIHIEKMQLKTMERGSSLNLNNVEKNIELIAN